MRPGDEKNATFFPMEIGKILIWNTRKAREQNLEWHCKWATLNRSWIVRLRIPFKKCYLSWNRGILVSIYRIFSGLGMVSEESFQFDPMSCYCFQQFLFGKWNKQWRLSFMYIRPVAKVAEKVPWPQKCSGPTVQPSFFSGYVSFQLSKDFYQAWKFDTYWHTEFNQNASTCLFTSKCHGDPNFCSICHGDTMFSPFFQSKSAGRTPEQGSFSTNHQKKALWNQQKNTFFFVPQTQKKCLQKSGFAIITWNNPQELEKPCITKGQYDLSIFRLNFLVVTYGCFLKWWYPQNTPIWSF